MGIDLTTHKQKLDTVTSQIRGITKGGIVQSKMFDDGTSVVTIVKTGEVIEEIPTGKCRCPQCGFVFLPHIAKTITAAAREIADVDSKEISRLISMFEPVNPSVYQLYKHKSQREAMGRLIKKHGVEKIKIIIQNLPEMNKQPYAPIVTTPYMLEAKLGQIFAFTAKKIKEAVDNEKRGVDARNL